MLLDIADEAAALQRLDVGGRAIALEIRRAGVDPERIVGEPAGDEASRLRLVEADHDVDLAPRERGQLRQRRQLQAHGRMALGEVAQRVGEIIGRESVRRADAHVARKFEIDAGDFALRVQEGALHLLGRADEPLARFGEPGPGRAPVEQPRADRGFERGDPAAHRRMVEFQPLGGGDELAAAGHGEKDADIVPVHDAYGSGIVSPDLDPVVRPRAGSSAAGRRRLSPTGPRSRGQSFPHDRFRWSPICTGE